MHAHKETRPMRLVNTLINIPGATPLRNNVLRLETGSLLQPQRRQLSKVQDALQRAHDEYLEYSLRYDELEQELDTVTCKSRTRLIVRQLNLLLSQREALREQIQALNEKACRLFAGLNASRQQTRRQAVDSWEYNLAMDSLYAGNAALQHPAA
jgi:chromosome segregation ATPase